MFFTANVALDRRLGCQMERDEEFKGGVVVHMSKAL